MDSTQFAIQAVRHDERQKVAARLRGICGLKVADVLAQSDFMARHGLPDASRPWVSGLLSAVAAEIESWPMPDATEEG